jgi:hypothetical protein
MLKWIKHSGASVIFTLNPLHWSLVPWVRAEYNEWAGPNERTKSVTCLFLTVRVWIDDGSW